MAVGLARIEPGVQIGPAADRTRFAAFEAHRSDSVLPVPGRRRLIEVEVGNLAEPLFPDPTGDGLSVLRRCLFGLVQMFESIPGPSLVVLREDPTLERLREWVEAMQGRFADYTHLYSARDFEPKRPEIEPATAVERFSYSHSRSRVRVGTR